MNIFDQPAYLKPSDPDGDVTIFGKAPGQNEIDTRNGIARLGGFWRQPDYARAYLKSAGVLLQHGQATGTLDDIALPAFYLQRHALELLVKGLLQQVYEIGEFRENKQIPSEGQKKRLIKSHAVKQLIEDLKTSCQALDLPNPPEELHDVALTQATYESTDTWARYATSESTKAGTVTLNKHMEQEVELPILSLQEKLQAAFTQTKHVSVSDDTYDIQLHAHWEAAARAAGIYDDDNS
ncbi:MAG: hypothetical protein RJB68_91 [Pseudomonadota bacterium]|jgi:hypothetical protein